MKPVKYRVFVNALTRLCAEHGIELEVISGAGGSHEALIFKDPANGRAVHATIARHKEVSPGVQRDMLKKLGRYAAHEAVSELANIVRQLLEDLLSGGL